jgi:D-alanyl-D-alanine dipeptidase
MSAVNSSNAGPPRGRPGVPTDLRFPRTRLSILVAAAVSCFPSLALSQSSSALLPGPKPPDSPAEWQALVGIYLDEDSKHSFILLEQNGKLFWRDEKSVSREFSVQKDIVFPPSEGERGIGHNIARDDAGRIKGFCYLNFCYSRTDAGSDPSRSYHVTPSRPLEELRREALAASPPKEKGMFRKADLVELTLLDQSIHLDIRYATSNDFLGTPVYSQARAFLQRPAAVALLRVQQKLKPLGYSLLIHDAYRPWYVTKIFWDATPPEGKIFVADPTQGSRHNRGCAVDLTLYDLATGKPIEMPGTYDEMSPRSFPNYAGGTALQRWHRDLLRRAMESEGFTVYAAEWWHFDYKDWKEYPILNVSFERLDSVSGSSPLD